jgi:hypothetical protein
MTTSIFFETNQKLSETIEPRKTSLDYPSPRFESRISPFFLDFFASLTDMRDIFPFLALLLLRASCVSLVSTKVLSSSYSRFRSLDHNFIQRRRQQFHIMRLGPADDEGQRDATTVDENTSLAPIFSPDPSGFCRQFQERAGLYPSRRQYFATARRYPPFRHIRQARPSISSRRNPLSAIRENSGGLRSGFQIHSSATPSIEFPSAKRTQSPQVQCVRESACGHRRLSECNSDGARVSFLGLMALLSPRIRPKSPMNRAFVSLVLPWKEYHLCRH